MGRLEDQKGHAHLLAALPELRREIPDLVVLLVGEGRRQEDLRRQVRELSLADTVRFLGTRRDLPEIYRALDLFVQPSLWEGLPLALLKAMGAGLPVVATRVSGSLEAIVDGVNGRLVPPGDPAALARAILEFAGIRKCGSVWPTRPAVPWRPGIPWRPCCGDWKNFTWTSGGGARQPCGLMGAGKAHAQRIGCHHGR